MKTKAIYFFFRFLQAFGWPVLLLYLLWRGLRRPAYFATLPERLGFLHRSFKQTVPGAIWLHAVSVGEILAAMELIVCLRREFPRSPLFVSTTTLAGYATAREKLAGVAAGVFYAPLDYAFIVRRVLRMLRPSLVIVLETEIWPNLFREVKRSGSGLMLVNGRISDGALPRYRRLRPLLAHVLPWADRILAQSERMRQRFLAIGAPAARVVDGGNLKYDFEPRRADPDAPVPRLLDRLRPAAVWMAASTMPPAFSGDVDEDDAVIAAFRDLAARHPGLLLILVPRKPERFDVAAAKLAAAGIPFLRRSALADTDTLSLPGVLLLDTMGELAGLFGFADVVFMGGTLAARGGHNILEAAFFARPVIIGPRMENFPDIAEDFLAAEACVPVDGPAALAAAVDALLTDRRRAAETGRRGLACARARGGATARAVAAAREVFDTALPCRLPTLPARLFLWPLSKLWEAGARRKRARALAGRRSLDAPVISVGNITMGGTGKTPFVLLVAEHLKSAGLRPGILTRGYGRHSPHKYLTLMPGQFMPVAQTGDEPQILIRRGVAAVGIGPDRFRAGQLLAELGVDAFILDDGFQHARLERRLDIVLIDALDPFGECRVFPLGRLREPFDALARADIFVITRGDYGRTVPAIERRLRRVNPWAPMFHASVRPETWVEHATAAPVGLDGLPSGPLAAFCGLGNPQSFWCTLDSLGLHPADCVVFGDHHAYRPHQLRRMSEQFRAAGARCVVTTEKDMLNLCPDCDALLAPLPLYWLRIRSVIDREEAFHSILEQVRTARF